jgi:hypothetical protein
MTPKQTALISMAKMIGLAILAATVTSVLLMFVPLPMIGIGLCLIGISILGKMIYDLELSKAESLEALNKTNKQ